MHLASAFRLKVKNDNAASVAGMQPRALKMIYDTLARPIDCAHGLYNAYTLTTGLTNKKMTFGH
jgi:hypothetical protein